MEIRTTNVNQALAEALITIRDEADKETSRNGDVLVFREPVMTTYDRPTERVLFSPLRDANPFFHFFESLWMLAGRDDVEFPAYFAGNMRNYSDDGKTFYGAYGARWRNWFGYDQLVLLAKELKERPDTRRAVLAMWDGGNPAHLDEGGEWERTRDGDLMKAIANGKDVPCNTTAYFDGRGGKLNLTVCCRSNDLWWGAYGANAVHFSVLQEYMAAWVGLPVGEYRQFSNNLHLYTNVVDPIRLSEFAEDAESHDYYEQEPRVKPFPLVNTDIETWNRDLSLFFENLDNNPVRPKFKDVFFTSVVWPMYRAWRKRKEKEGTGLEDARVIGARDWKRAAIQWIERREARKVEAE